MIEDDAPRLIVAFLSRGQAHRLAHALHDREGLQSFHFNHGRGAGMLETIAARDVVEVDILSIVVEAERADEVFAFVYETAGIDRPAGGLLLQAPLDRTVVLGPPVPPSDVAADPSSDVSG